MARWPVLPRESERDAVLAALRGPRPRSVMLRGPSGVGKTTLGAHISQALRADGRTVIPVIGLAELVDVPLGALAPVLASSGRHDLESVSDRVQALVGVVGENPQKFVLVIDDAPLLDAVSASVLYQLVRVFGVTTLLTARDSHELDGPIARLLHENLIDIVELEGLSLEHSQSILQQYLGGTLRPESLRGLFEASRGNPLMLRELIFAAARAGGIHSGDFGVEVSIATLPKHVRATIADRVQQLTTAQRRLAQLIAIAQPIPRAAMRAEETDALAFLTGEGIVEDAGDETTPLLRLAHPLFAEALTIELTQDTRAELVTEIAGRLIPMGDQQLRFTATVLLISTDAVISNDDLDWAASYAHAAGDHAVAASLAERAQLSERRFAPELVLASALSALAQSDRASAVFESAIGLSGDDEQRAIALARWGQHMVYRLSRPSDAVDRVTCELSRMDARAQPVLRPELAKWQLMTGDAQALAEVADPVSPEGGLGAVNAGLTAAMIATMAGNPADAFAAILQTRPLANAFRFEAPFASSLLDLSEFLALVASAEIGRARDFATQRRLDRFADSAGVWSFALAIVRLHEGRLSDAQSLATLAVEQLKWRDFTGLLGTAIALHATVDAQLGEPETARELLSEITPEHAGDAKVILQRAECEAWLLAAEGRTDEAAGVIVAAAAEGIILGHFLLSALTLTVAIRVGHPAVAREQLELLTHLSPSPLVASIRDWAEVAAEADVARLCVLAPALASSGLAALAVDGLLAGARTAAKADRRELERKATLLARRLAADMDQVPGESHTAELTEREWTIARAAAGRKRSREIGQQLGLSVRTVDNHLARIYRKLGVKGRVELEEVLAEL
ncbi:LuxR C-terminal-related transcriptional regulator [Salinibacterium sp. SWN167]|uniref:LuxR C-terminal-related transcriptional regulator n=1 Tax=Salinibacterium sp. SWN167 TaxID=2792054 RepID=UPI0018CD60BF|nr:LuxR C-terminal-related transcriptional regulator [Salinibacterium sp. SWN167]MBH0081872.1 NACHT domain-containing protein [Salinibacterium sp. SWN167]